MDRSRADVLPLSAVLGRGRAEWRPGVAQADGRGPGQGLRWLGVPRPAVGAPRRPGAIGSRPRGILRAPMVDQIVEAWRTNHRINLRLIERISEAGMRCTLSTRGGRNVVRQFAHLHNVRVWHLNRRAKSLAKGARTFATYDEPDRRALVAAMSDSARRVEDLFRLASEGAPGVRTIKRGLIPYLAYFIAHESHHRGNILLTLKQCGHPVDSTTRYAIWDWDRI